MAGITPRVRLVLTPVLKLVIAVVGLLLLQAAVSALPMVREIPVPSGLPLPVVAIVRVVIATVILVLLVNFAFEIEDNLEIAFPVFPQGGVIARWVILLVAVLIAYNSYHILAETFLGTYVWLYSLVFLGLAMAPLVNIVLLSYRHLDALIGAVVGGRYTFRAQGETERAGSRCANCGVVLNPGAKFCRGCGSSVPEHGPARADSARCARCGAALSGGSQFCPECGTQATGDKQ